MKDKKSYDISGLLGSGSHFEGQINFDGTLRIDGSVYGQIMCKNSSPSMVIITEMAKVEADIIADVVVISGTVSGNIKAVDKLEIHAPGRLEGLVYTSDFSIEDGALFQGECIMIRHLSAEDKQYLKMEGFYNIHHHQLINENRKTLQSPIDDSTIIEL
ncbi:MAG: polymer-forming cytoskeletal protein [Proteobacteria bacterium]|nr:polymer-forming cytoskeletal protein [Pseudomonadota bacterium]